MLQDINFIAKNKTKKNKKYSSWSTTEVVVYT